MSMIHINSEQLSKSKFDVTLDEKCNQPNAVDLPVKDIYFIDPVSTVNLSTKQHAKRKKVEPVDGVYTLTGGKYDIVFEPKVEIAHGEAGFLIQRSSLNRNGITVTSGLYDSGYNNIVGGCLHVPEGMTLEFNENERLAQFLLFGAETLGLYDGVYNKQ